MTPGPDEHEAPKGKTRVDPFTVGPPFMSGSSADVPGGMPSADSSAGPTPTTIKPGQVILGHYLIKRQLGEGGMGSVWLVEDQTLKTDRALKLIASGYAEVPEARARFQREAQVMAKVKHEHAVVIHTAQLVGATAAIVMEYIHGDSLDKLLKSGPPMSLDKVSWVLGQLCSVLQVAHDQGIVHRDLKPSNLMLVAGLPGGEVFLKVLDFGLAKFLGAEQNEAITRSKGAFGSVPYMSPEQAGGKDMDARSDIYSTGVILYEMLTGHLPFQGPLYKVMFDHVNTPPAPFQKIAPECRVPPGVERVVMQCLEKDPARRPVSARALAEAFQKAMVPLVKPRPAPPVKPRPEPRSKPRVPIGAVAAGFAVVAVLVALAYPILVGVGPSGTVPVEFDAPLDGLKVALDGFPIDVRGPLTLRSGSHRIVVTQGDFIAADTNFRVTPGANVPLQIGLKRRATLRFQPPSATVSVEAARQTLDKDGGLSLVFAGSEALAVRAWAEGYTSFSERLTFERMAGRRFEVLLKRDDSRLAESGRSFLQRYCHRCHGVDFKAPGLDVLDRNALTALRAPGGAVYLVPGKPGESAIWKQVEAGKMPPKSAGQPTRADRDALKTWVEAGAPGTSGPRRPFQTEGKVLEAVRDDLQNAPIGDRRFHRYFTLTHLFNNPAVRDEELVLHRAALSKAINSLSRQASIVVPLAVNREATVYRIDLRKLAWNWDEAWPQLLQKYPYGLGQDRGAGAKPALRELSREVYKLCGSDLPYVRADWFVAWATRPPLYHDLLKLPETAADLELQLELDVEDDFKNDRLARAGLTTSGVSVQNRLVERHATAGQGYYWKSYDFSGFDVESDLLRFPLGPFFEGNPFAAHAFKHTSSAIIFSLPNGLQGYMLVDKDGKRKDHVDTAVLRDPQETSGTGQVVVNGLSCLACHRLGVNPVVDEVRNGNNLPDDPLQKVEQIYPPMLTMAALVLGDRSRFQTALAEAVEPFLKAGDQTGPRVDELPEPIEFVARRFRSDLQLVDIACELGFEDVDLLGEQIRGTPELARLGLPTAAGATIKRQAWGATSEGWSLFQRVASVLRLGVPARAP